MSNSAVWTIFTSNFKRTTASQPKPRSSVGAGYRFGGPLKSNAKTAIISLFFQRLWKAAKPSKTGFFLPHLARAWLSATKPTQNPAPVPARNSPLLTRLPGVWATMAWASASPRHVFAPKQQPDSRPGRGQIGIGGGHVTASSAKATTSSPIRIYYKILIVNSIYRNLAAQRRRSPENPAIIRPAHGKARGISPARFHMDET